MRYFMFLGDFLHIISRFTDRALDQGCSRAIVQPASNIAYNPVETRNKILSCYGAARPYNPVVRVYRSKIKSLGNAKAISSAVSKGEV